MISSNEKEHVIIFPDNKINVIIYQMITPNDKVYVIIQPDDNINLSSILSWRNFMKKVLLNTWANQNLLEQKSKNLFENSAPSFKINPLGSCLVQNSKAAFTHTVYVIASIASWIKKRFCGFPFYIYTIGSFQCNLNSCYSATWKSKNLHCRTYLCQETTTSTAILTKIIC